MGEVIADGLWRDILNPDISSAIFAGRPALFCDRDGTLIENVPYNSDPARVRPIAAAVIAVRRANDAGWPVVIVTNQSGVGRGRYDWGDVAAVQARMYELFAIGGARFDAVYAAGHAPPDAGGPPTSGWRKPAPGMFLRAAEDLRVDLARSVIAGDVASDIEAGLSAGLTRGLLMPGQDDAAFQGLAAAFSDVAEIAAGPMTALAFD
ncbi:MAG: HAD-IIIA family hydrolase [Alphaproteobacteria bacterium]|jgi:D-glycero-D-manno-heptose 1,7-bisphosphate phosphatase